MMRAQQARPLSILHVQLRRLVFGHHSLDDLALEVLRLKDLYGRAVTIDALRDVWKHQAEGN
jgi:hypothetical protein